MWELFPEGIQTVFFFRTEPTPTELKKLLGTQVEILPDKLNAVGNIVLANDSTAVVHPELSDKALETIARTLKVEVYRGTIAGIKNVGMAGVVTNEGLMVHPKVTASEREMLEEIFGALSRYRHYKFWDPDAWFRLACKLKELFSRF